MFYAFAFVLLLIIELAYFKIADKYNIIDKPNHRSSHQLVTIRGGGIIFPLSLMLCLAIYGFMYPFFFMGLILISTVSFIDDIKSVSSKIRFGIHLAAVALIFLQLDMFKLPFYWIFLALIFFIGTINAINFMDGINGITGVFGLVTLCTLYYINLSIHFTIANILLIGILGVVVFNFFNFRIKAKCFAGDVGSVSLGFIIVFFILQLIIKTQNLSYLLLLLLYGLDAGTTIFFRLLKKENILEAHRSHLYQFLANEKRISHLTVATIYGLVQLAVNVLVVSISIKPVFLAVVILACVLLFVAFRFSLEGSDRLLKKTFTKVNS